MPAAEPRRIFLLIQALRGLAAAWVVLFHIAKGQYVIGLTDRLPHWIGYILFDYGSAGVAIFFVLSGFVISHGLAGHAMDGRGYLRFIARRSIRLDPPYWASIVLTVGVGAAIAMMKHRPVDIPSVGTTVAHILYLQELLRVPEIGFVYWSLTYEVQFYLILALACWGTTILVARGVQAERAQAVVLLPLGLLALVAALLARDWAIHGLFVNLWHGFFLGVLSYEAGVRGRWWPALAILAAATLFGALHAGGVFGVPCAITALALWAAARTGYLDRGLAGRGWQFLGRISYSLYLIHVPMVIVTFSLWGRLAGRGLVADLAGLLLMGGVVIALATGFWWLVERPAHRLSARLFGRKAEPALSARL